MTAPTLTRMPLADDARKALGRLSATIATKTAERDQRICEAYKAGASMREIARAVNMTHPGVRNILIRNGVYDASRSDSSDE